ncbi:unnamed protein product [Brassica oleracea]
MFKHVQERDLSVDELLEAEEVFCTGTAVVVKAVETVTFHDRKTGEEALSTEASLDVDEYSDRPLMHYSVLQFPGPIRHRFD